MGISIMNPCSQNNQEYSVLMTGDLLKGEELGQLADDSQCPDTVWGTPGPARPEVFVAFIHA
jgi:hypothetical protein